MSQIIIRNNAWEPPTCPHCGWEQGPRHDAVVRAMAPPWMVTDTPEGVDEACAAWTRRVLGPRS